MSFRMHPQRIWLAVIIAAGSVFRLIGLNSDLWLDEVGTVITYLRLPASEVIRTFHSANQHLLYSILGSLSFSLFGESAWSARLPAVLFGIGAIPGLYYFARVMVCRREALFCAALLAFSYHHVWFSQNARGYSAMVFWSVWGTGFFLRAVEDGKRSFWFGWVVSMAAGICSLNNTAFVFLGQLAAWAALRHRYKGVSYRLFAGAAGVILLAVLSHSLILEQMVRFYRTEDRTALGWFSIGEFAPVVFHGLIFGLGAAGLLGFTFLMGAGWLSLWKTHRLASLVMVIPPVLNGMALVALHYGAYPRSFLYLLPVAIIIAVRGAMAIAEWAMEHRLLTWNAGTLMLSVVLAVNAPFVIKNYLHPKQDYSGALAFVEGAKAPGDVVVALGLAGNVYRRYYAPSILVPSDAAEVAGLRRGKHAIWVLYSFPRDMKLRFGDLYAYITSNSRPVKVFPGTLSDGEIHVVRIEAAHAP